MVWGEDKPLTGQPSAFTLGVNHATAQVICIRLHFSYTVRCKGTYWAGGHVPLREVCVIDASVYMCVRGVWGCVCVCMNCYVCVPEVGMCVSELYVSQRKIGRASCRERV